MMGGVTPPPVTSPAQIRQQVAQLGSSMRVDATGNAVRYTASRVALVAVGSPPGRSGM
jgi:hypothetical protein